MRIPVLQVAPLALKTSTRREKKRGESGPLLSQKTGLLDIAVWKVFVNNLTA